MEAPYSRGPYISYKGELLYRVGHILADLGWGDLDLECSVIMLRQ